MHEFTFHPTPVFEDGELVAGIDWLGNRFVVDDTVMYCIAAGRGQMMALGKVLKLEMAELGYWQLQAIEAGRNIHHELRVQVLTSRTSGSWNNKQRTRPAWVNGMNITAVAGLERAALL